RPPDPPPRRTRSRSWPGPEPLRGRASPAQPTLVAGLPRVMGGGGSGRSVVAPPDDNDLAIHEIRRAPVQEAVAVGVGPGNEPIETLAAEEGPHRRPIHEEVLDALGSELVPVTHP